MLDEMILVNVSKFAIFLEYENLCQHRPTRAFIGGKIAGNDKKNYVHIGSWVFIFKKYGKF